MEPAGADAHSKEAPLDPRQENRDRLAKLGITVGDGGSFGMTPELAAKMPADPTPDPEVDPGAGDSGAFSAPPEPPPAVPPAPAPAPKQDEPPVAPPTPEPVKPTAPALNEEQVRALERRAEAAKTEQRALSKLQAEIRQDQATVRALIEELKALKTQLPAPPAAPAVSNEALEALKAASPALYEAVVATISSQVDDRVKAAVGPVLQVKDELETHKQALAKSAADEAFDKVTSAVEAGRKGALDLVNTSDFQEWLVEQPAFIKAPAINAIYENTSGADPKHILWVIGQYDKAKAPAPPTPPPTPRVAPAIPVVPAGGAPSATGTGPLSEAELANFGRLKAAVEHDPSALANLMNRLRLTSTATT